MNAEQKSALLLYQQKNMFEAETVRGLLPGWASDPLSRLGLGYGNFPAVGPGIAASEMLAHGYTVDARNIADPEMVNLVKNSDHDLIFLAGMDVTLDRIRELARLARKPESVVMCGIGPSADKNRLIDEFRDSHILDGESEGVLGDLLEDHRRGQMGSVYKRSKPVDLADCMQEPYTNPKYTFRQRKPFSNGSFAAQELVRGCGLGCVFCNARHHVTHKRVGDAIRELDTLQFNPLQKVLFFPDDNIFALPNDWLEEYFSEVNRRGIHWIGEGTLWSKRNAGDLLRNVVAKNCIGFLVGLEDPLTPLEGVPPKQKLQENLDDMVEFSREVGLPVTWSIVFGLDHQGPDYFARVYDRVKCLGINVNSHILRPYTGTVVNDRVTKQGRWRDGQSIHRNGDYVTYDPKSMTADELMVGIRWFREKAFSKEKMLTRFATNTKCLGPVKAAGLFAVDYGGDHWGAKRLGKMYPELNMAVDEYDRNYQAGKYS